MSSILTIITSSSIDDSYVKHAILQGVPKKMQYYRVSPKKCPFSPFLSIRSWEGYFLGVKNNSKNFGNSTK